MTQPHAPDNVGVMAPPETSAAHSPQAVAVIPKRATCPICQTTFDPRASTGKCPVCGEQVVPPMMVTRTIPVITPLWHWLRAGGWRLALLVVFVLYQLVLFLGLWHQFTLEHLL